jgi:hypothetical protein
LKTQLDAAQTELGVTNTALEAEKAKVAELQGSLDEAKERSLYKALNYNLSKTCFIKLNNF